ncbi:predicted protein, partial [Naegleria gruberi]
MPSLDLPVELKNVTILQFTNSYYGNLLLADDAVYSWGKNDYGVDADGTTVNHYQPRKVFSWDLQGPKGIAQIASGPYNFYAIDENGKLYSWGKNDFGQLGDRTPIDKWRPVDVFMKGALLNQTVTRVCGGLTHTLVLANNGMLYSFGDNSKGQLGIGVSSSVIAKKWEPVLINFPFNDTIADIQCGDNHNLVLLTGGAMYAWGLNDYGQLGDNTTTTRTKPTKVNTLSAIGPKRIEQIGAGGYTFYVIDENGKAYAWGRNNRGQLGDKTTIDKPRPVDVYMKGILLNQTVIRVCGGESHTLLLTSNNELAAMGDNTYGQLGVGTSGGYKMEPTRVNIKFNGTIMDIQCGENYNLVLTSKGLVYGWGRNDVGQLGSGDKLDKLEPTLISYLKNSTVVKIYARFSTSFALTNESFLYAWGNNNQYQLG